MASLSAYPPSIIPANSSKPIQLPDAQQLLADYLNRSETTPHLHPDALLQASGPTFSVQGGPQGGLVLHQLRRVEAGLRGEILKPDPKWKEKEGDDERLDALIAESQVQTEEEHATPSKMKGALKRRAEEMDPATIDGVQDPSEEIMDQPIDSDDEVNVAEGVETGEMGDRSNLVEDGGEIPAIKAISKTRAEKDAKKAAKKARRQQEKKDRALQRQAPKQSSPTAIDRDADANTTLPTGSEGRKEKKKKKKHREEE